MKNIVIIGGSRGIGLAAAKELAAAGHRLLIVGRNRSHLDEAKAQDGIVISAAAFPDPATQRSVLKPEAEELSQILEQNVVACYRFVRELFPLLKKQKGRIVLIGSTAGVRRDKGGIYGISKWALRDFAYQLRDECKASGVSVSLVNPGGTFTERRVKKCPEDTTLLETSDLGKVIALIFELSRQAVIEQVDIRPLSGDTY